MPVIINLLRTLWRDMRIEPEIAPLLFVVSGACTLAVAQAFDKLFHGPDISLDHVHYNYEKDLGKPRHRFVIDARSVV